jgi:hypothetical protein
MWGGTVLIHVLPNVVTRITPDNAESSPLPDPHVSGERGLATQSALRDWALLFNRFAVAGLHTGSRRQSRRPTAAIDLSKTTKAHARGSTFHNAASRLKCRCDIYA